LQSLKLSSISVFETKPLSIEFSRLLSNRHLMHEFSAIENEKGEGTAVYVITAYPLRGSESNPIFGRIEPVCSQQPTHILWLQLAIRNQMRGKSLLLPIGFRASGL
jgi:hypothetical protein